MHKENLYILQNTHIDISLISFLNHQLQTEPKLDFEINFNSSLGEYYHIEIKNNYQVTITTGHKRGIDYALETIYHHVKNNTLYTGIIEDKPQFKLRGIIEGFYGPPWTHEDRLDMISFLRNEHMNTYMYAPKNDIYHRKEWRKPYPKEELSLLLELIHESHKQQIDFYFCISPGLDFNYTNPDDFSALFTKIDTIISYGVTHFCLLLDDIDYRLTGSDLSQFQTPGKAHSYISNQLYQHLQHHDKAISLIMCPTDYWQNFDTPYHQDIKQHLHPDILVFWTGYHTIAEFIPNIDGEHMREYFGHNLVLWDNYPVNDMTRDLLFMGPLVHRGNQLHQSHFGMVSNPMIEWSLSKPALYTMSEYMWNPMTYNAEDAYQKALQKTCYNGDLLESFTRILENFRHSIISYYKNEEIFRLIEDTNIDGLIEYYQLLLHDIERLHQLDDRRFLEQITPWLNRMEFDYQLLKHIQKNNITEVRKLLQQVPSLTHTVTSNYALRYAKKIGLYEGRLFKKKRTNIDE